MVSFPYSSLSWYFFDPPSKEKKNEEYIKKLTEKFNGGDDEDGDGGTRVLLAESGDQIEKVIKKGEKPQIQLDFLDMNINDEGEKKEMIQQHKE